MFGKAEAAGKMDFRICIGIESPLVFAGRSDVMKTPAVATRPNNSTSKHCMKGNRQQYLTET